MRWKLFIVALLAVTVGVVIVFRSRDTPGYLADAVGRMGCDASRNHVRLPMPRNAELGQAPRFADRASRMELIVCEDGSGVEYYRFRSTSRLRRALSQDREIRRLRLCVHGREVVIDEDEPSFLKSVCSNIGGRVVPPRRTPCRTPPDFGPAAPRSEAEDYRLGLQERDGGPCASTVLQQRARHHGA